DDVPPVRGKSGGPVCLAESSAEPALQGGCRVAGTYLSRACTQSPDLRQSACPRSVEEPGREGKQASRGAPYAAAQRACLLGAHVSTAPGTEALPGQRSQQCARDRQRPAQQGLGG